MHDLLYTCLSSENALTYRGMLFPKISWGHAPDPLVIACWLCFAQQSHLLVLIWKMNGVNQFD